MQISSICTNMQLNVLRYFCKLLIDGRKLIGLKNFFFNFLKTLQNYCKKILKIFSFALSSITFLCSKNLKHYNLFFHSASSLGFKFSNITKLFIYVCSCLHMISFKRGFFTNTDSWKPGIMQLTFDCLTLFN